MNMDKIIDNVKSGKLEKMGNTSAELMWVIDIIKDFCKISHKDDSSNSFKYIDKIYELCEVVESRFEFTEGRKDVKRLE